MSKKYLFLLCTCIFSAVARATDPLATGTKRKPRSEKYARNIELSDAVKRTRRHKLRPSSGSAFHGYNQNNHQFYNGLAKKNKNISEYIKFDNKPLGGIQSLNNDTQYAPDAPSQISYSVQTSDEPTSVNQNECLIIDLIKKFHAFENNFKKN